MIDQPSGKTAGLQMFSRQIIRNATPTDSWWSRGDRLVMRVLGVIPARGGSEGIPRKNLREVAGKPLIAYAIECAASASSLTDFVTSTDDPEISAVAQECGSTVIERPSELAADDTPMAETVLHALVMREGESGIRFDAVVVLQPTSPIRTGLDVDAALRMLDEDTSADSVVSVVAMDDVHPARMYSLKDGQRMVSLWPSDETDRRQDLSPVYFRNGAIYAARRNLLADSGLLMGPEKRAYEMSSMRLLNIDSKRDLIVAEALVPMWKRGEL